MDIVTQGLLGGVLGQSVAREGEKRIATLVGVVSGMLADADILIQSSSDPLLNIEFHRHFSHSLIFIPFGALIAALMLWPVLRKRLQFSRIYLYALAGFSLSGVLDACTSYGTHLLWPFSDERIAFHIIAIVDPVFTLILFLGLVFGLRMQARQFARYALLLASAYMGLGFIQMQRAELVAAELATSRGHVPVKSVVKPTMGNLLLWRSVYIYSGRIYVDGVRVSPTGPTKIYTGGSVGLFDPVGVFPELERDTVLSGDIERFTRFSDGFVSIHPEHPNVLGDIRYSMLPTSVSPLWGIVMDKNYSSLHVDYRFYRQMTMKDRAEFKRMLFGD